jgi:1-acyl-sn-glycerol-3-phosphate acyltransferase
VPISINNSWKLLRYGKFPMGIGNHLKFQVHEPIKIATFVNKEELIHTVEETISSNIHP